MVAPILGADEETRTPNLLFTKQLLCQLSYVGGRLTGVEHGTVSVTFHARSSTLIVCHEATCGRFRECRVIRSRSL
jgi:hypothetical protein